ncbi:hypothetical protein ACOTCT_27430, partial [Achromobacter xylosoxidans]
CIMGVWPAWASAAVVCVAEFMPVIVSGRGGVGEAGSGAFAPGQERNPARVLQQKRQEHDSVEENEEAEYAQRKLLGESVRAA